MVNDNKKSYNAKNLVIATGSSPTSLPGIEIDEKNLQATVESGVINQVFKDIDSRLEGYPFTKLSYNPKQSNTYTINAHWALYCENYLEGFHIPYVHEGLNNDIDWKNYETHVLDKIVLQKVKSKNPDNSSFFVAILTPNISNPLLLYFSYKELKS